MSIFYSGALLAGAFGNLIAAGILDGLAGVRGISAWRWLYIIEGTSKFHSTGKKLSNSASHRLRRHNRLLLLAGFSANLASIARRAQACW